MGVEIRENRISVVPETEQRLVVDELVEHIHLATKDEKVIVDVREIGVPGVQGSKGDQGDPGIQGPSGEVVAGSGDISYTHSQIEPVSTWTITHNLGKYPSVNVTDSAGTVVTGDIFYQSTNVVIVDFDAPFGGKAHLN